MQFFSLHRRKDSLRLHRGLTLIFPLLALIFGLAMSSCELHPTPPNRYALVYGASDYSNGVTDLGSQISSLNYTDDDARAVAELLYTKGYEVHLRIDDDIGPYSYADSIANASKAQFENDIANIASVLKKDDLLVIYFSGHGGPYILDSKEDQFSDEYQEIIIFYPPAGNEGTEDYYLSDNVLQIKLKDLEVEKKVVIIDACNSGGFIGQSSDFDALAPDYQFTDAYREDIFSSTMSAFFSPSNSDITPSNAIMITAAGERETSAEPRPEPENDPLNVQNGFFTESLLEAFIHGDYNHDGYIDTLEAYRYTLEYFRYLQPIYGIEYLPHISGGSVDYVLFETD